MEWKVHHMAGDALRRSRLQRVGISPPPLQEGVGQALRGIYRPELVGLPQDMKELLDQLK